jgi:hypothetical protein
MPSLLNWLDVSEGATHQEKILQDTSFGQLQTLHSEYILIVLRVLLHILLAAISITANYCPTNCFVFVRPLWRSFSVPEKDLMDCEDNFNFVCLNCGLQPSS